MRYETFTTASPHLCVGWQVCDTRGRLIAQSALIDAYEYSVEGQARADEDARNLAETLQAVAARRAARPAPVYEEECVPA